MPLRLNEIYVYPIKSCRGISLETARVNSRGIEHDREWMIIDAAKGVFLTQRELPKLAIIETALSESAMTMRIPGGDEFSFPFDDVTGSDREATVWGSECRVLDCGDAAARALTGMLEPEGKRELRLVRLKPDFVRTKMTGTGSISFVDVNPFHGIARASLDDLNNRLPDLLPMDRFRPNFIFHGCPAYDEDTWKRFKIGEITFVGDFKCIRCAMTMVDQTLGESVGPEPLATLAQYRKMGMKVVFGAYFSHENEGVIRRDERIEILERS